jgi:hypothetical protein
MANELKKQIQTNKFQSALRQFNLQKDLTDMVIVKQRELAIDCVGQMILIDDIITLMQHVKEKKIEFDPTSIGNWNLVQILIIPPYMIVKEI